MRFSSAKKYGVAFFLTLGLMVLVSCWSPKVTQTAESSLQQAQTMAEGMTQQLITQTPQTPRFAQPIDCQLGEDCFILLYPDRDPSPKAVDFGCGRQTYDGHQGTDFAIPDEQAMARGVPVVASAAGTVLRVRDGVVDKRIAQEADKTAVEGTECGNGVVIDHRSVPNGAGWETQYCHLRQGSLRVKPGDTVEKGTILGSVGASGLASFPHVHLTIRYNGEVIDPFVGPGATAGCNVTRNPIWEQSLAYIPTGLIRAGFSTQPPTMDELWQGKFNETILLQDSPALLFWVQVYGVLTGDKMIFNVYDSQGIKVVNNESFVNESSKTWIGYVGKKNNPQSPLTPGNWKAEYQLIRGDRILVKVQRQLQLQ
ncbi:M23 family metallopeptidase [Planktothrix mougeotii]|uniref:M23 family metallopeptidase n=1 Tax=Planktothrix mougeotii LEGE 06226 TaxID=1828728 RepID=A0ABR9U883_9CYAN|nr:M23 family metallopeptidase [Planktothrix mougeotii]MBE9142339.1 M23 family metallopeptidase [Planktothrix mougeotii LEGE 06226]